MFYPQMPDQISKSYRMVFINSRRCSVGDFLRAENYFPINAISWPSRIVLEISLRTSLGNPETSLRTSFWKSRNFLKIIQIRETSMKSVENNYKCCFLVILCASQRLFCSRLTSKREIDKTMNTYISCSICVFCKHADQCKGNWTLPQKRGILAEEIHWDAKQSWRPLIWRLYGDIRLNLHNFKRVENHVLLSDFSFNFAVVNVGSEANNWTSHCMLNKKLNFVTATL